jgi:hypothetical protein
MSRRSGVIKRGGLAALAWCVAALVGMASAGCGADDNSNPPPPQDASVSDTSPEATTPPKDAAPDTTMPPPTGTASVQLSPTSMDFSMAVCGGQTGTILPLNVTNSGTGPLAVAAKVTGTSFSVSPTSLTVQAGMTGTLMVAAAIDAAAPAGTMVSGSLSLFTNDPVRGNITVPLSATATGATLTISPNDPTTFAFPTTAVGQTSAPITLHLVNTGNAPATFTLSPPSDPEFVLSGLPDGGSMILNPNDVIAVTAQFTPTSAAMVTATTAITASGTTCGNGVADLSLSGQGGKGTVNGWKPTIDFGPALCGAQTPPAEQMFQLVNSGPADAHITAVSITPSNSGFTTNAKVGRAVFANNGVLAVTVDAPTVPTNSPTTPITATLSITIDSDPSPHTTTLTEEPTGASLEWDTSGTPNFGSFGPVVLLKSTTQDFKIKNTGTAPADVTLTYVPTSENDGGAGEGGSTGGVPPFVIATPSFTVNGPGEQDDTVVFTPQSAQAVTGSIHITATGAVCGSAPGDLSLSGSGLGGGPTVVPTSLVLGATCGLGAPAAQTFLVRNDGTADFTWNLALGSGVQLVGTTAGPDAGPTLYTISASHAPGLLHPGESSLVTVNGFAIPSGGANPDPSAYAAQVTVTTDVPLDPPHVVSINTNPLGDQIAVTGPTPLRYGQIPIGTSIDQKFLVTNYATAGSPAANLTFQLSGAGASGYTVTPMIYANLASGVGASTRETLTFQPTAAMSYPATLTIVTSDHLCTPLPPPMTISGTGTNGSVSLSTQSMAFGSDPNDTAGLVNCGMQGPAHTFTVSNIGNQTFDIKALTLGKGSSSPFQVSGAGTLPAALPIGGSVTLTVTPSAIPQSVANPSDTTLFADTLTITTDASGDTPHVVSLVMQARGAVILNTMPAFATNWPFGTINFGSIGTLTSSITNAGNSGVTIGLTGLMHPGIFGLQNPKTKVPGGNAPTGIVTNIVGTFTPSASDGMWSDQGSLVVIADQTLCAPLPMQWNSPTITMSGASNSTPSITSSGNLVFPTTECGSPAPPAQTVTLTNATNVSYPFTLAFSSGGKYYTTTPAVDGGTPDGGAGMVPANGSAQILVTPQAVTPGPGVLAGTAPYADELLVTVATNPATHFAIPISWALSGAVLSLPSGHTRTDAMGHAYYPADSMNDFTLPILNTGNESVTLTVTSQPTGAFSLSSTTIPPGSSPTTPVLTAAAGTTPMCSASPMVLTVGSLGFGPASSGAVCQPLPTSVIVEGCDGALP